MHASLRRSAAPFVTALALAASLISCINVDPPEGVLVCTPATQDVDCPDGWSCRGTRCYRTPGEAVDAGMDAGGNDAFVAEPDAFELDAPALDAPRPDAPNDAFSPFDAGMADAPMPDAFVVPDAFVPACEVATEADDCDDADECTLDSCVDGRCAYDAVVCNDGFSCTVDACAPAAGCTHPPNPLAPCPMGRTCDPMGSGMDGMGPDANGCVDADDCTTAATCDDGAYCTIDTCSTGACVNAARSCSSDSNPCTLPAFCDEEMDRCNEPFDATSVNDPTHCGTSAATCAVCMTTFPNTVSTCAVGACGVACATNFHNVDADMLNGCEYACTFSSSTDAADASAVDSNCDGADGTIASASYIYVTPSGMGAPSMGGSPATAVNIARAFELATTRSGSGTDVTLLLASGTYSITRALDAAPRLTMWGGYALDFRSRSAASRSTVASSDTRALNVSAAITIDSVDFSTADQTSSSAYTRTIWISGSPSAVLRNLTVTAGAGGAGVGGTTGMNRTGTTIAAMNGGNGMPGVGGLGGGSSGAPSSGGVGAPAGSLAGPGFAASVTGSGCGTPGGGRGVGAVLVCACLDNFATTSDGATGTMGCAGGAGSQGAGASGFGTLSSGGWSPAVGGSGGDGMPAGGGGSGGGGAGGASCGSGSSAGLGQMAAGGGGGQGGAGGAGGGGGGAGTSGGGSFGIVAISTTLTLTNVTISPGRGGAGGTGGSGGMGATGQAGGRGGDGQMVNFSCSGGPGRLRGGRGGDGANGGLGGTGGCGGGGAGGPSVGLFGTGSTLTGGSTVTYTAGIAGTPGGECTSGGGNRGGTGVVMNQLLL